LSLDLQHSLNIGRSLACAGDIGRAAAHLDRLRTLDVHRQHGRAIALLSVVVSVRAQQIDVADQALAAISPLSAPELQSLSDMLASTPEAAYPDYRRFVRKLLRRSDPVAVSADAGARRRLFLWGGAALALVVVGGALVAALASRPKVEGPDVALARMLGRLESGQFVELWESLPERFRIQGDLAFRSMMGRLPPATYEDFRTIDRGLSGLVFERVDRLSGSRVDSLGPVFRTLSGEEDARGLARYLKALSESKAYDRNWLAGTSTVAEFIGEFTGGDFSACWRTYLRRWVLDQPMWPMLLGIDVDRLGAFLTLKRTFAISRPDDGSGRAMVAILTSGNPNRVDVAMRLVEGVWIPDVLAQQWELVSLQVKNDAKMADQALAYLLRFRPDFALAHLDRRKLLIIEAGRAKSQEEFDERARLYFDFSR
jgi:hypothetical protein